MSAQRFLGKTSKSVLKDVRAALGDDAVIISNRTTSAGVEVLAMAGMEMTELIDAIDAPRSKPVNVPVRASEPLSTRVEVSFQDYLEKSKARASIPTKPVTSSNAPINPRAARATAEYQAVFAAQMDHPETMPTEPAPVRVERPAHREGTAKQPNATWQTTTAPRQGPSTPSGDVASVDTNRDPDWSAAAPSGRALNKDSQNVMDELRSMKGLLREQLSNIVWADKVGKSPVQAKYFAKLLQAGFTPLLSRTLIEKMPANISEPVAQEWLAKALNQNLLVAANGAGIVESGGVYALVGPTGVGKTTTVAKLAARAAMRFGAKSVGIITIDHYRIGAHEQLRSFGKMLGCPVHVAHDGAALNDLLIGMRGKHLVLIDTVGLPQRDPSVNDQLSILMGPRIERVIVLNAASQTETLEEVVGTWRGPRCSRVVITKIDEAVKLGGVVDMAIRHRLVVDCVANGQRVPEDIHQANGPLLVHRALKANENAVFQMRDEELSLVAAPVEIFEGVGEQRA
jgi:flagellar biosynthesis protein FlhF